MQRKALAAVAVATLLVVASVGVVAIGTGNDASQEAQNAQQDSETISVSATGSAGASPDEGVVRVSVRAEANDSESVRSSLADDAAALRSALDELGVSYETTRYSIESVHPRERERQPDAPEYRGVHAFEVTVDDPDRVGAVIDAAANASAEIDGVQLTLSDERREELRNAAIEDAMGDASTQATTIAASANLTVTGVASVDATQGNYQPVAYQTEAAAGGDAAQDTVIDSGEVTVTYDVRVTYNATS
ncbi:SIMPL domain-containing protein [Halorubellus sp. JP-L1]|uniref:SIMPL domain-containing protein n=1 Tax=Halorubellus sp. JP-L1 TaxID=2715753 RepID=UPI00140D1E96|nr:SIMPL domain-containing protein [Halorubellus sp. JP-L1]NHN42286.1 SIMPL domain-containing protein [Halorubellus sp. JP-L1]